ncbi:MAG: hypothetical protein ACREQF_04395, partial [Candidatus Binataceae bacterium]
VLTKSQDWSYEDEWRIIVPKGRSFYDFRPDALTGVIFGPAISEADRAKVQKWISQGPCRPNLYQARLNEQDFRVDVPPESS